MGSQGLHLRASAHLLHQVHLKQPLAGDAWLVARLAEIFHHLDKKEILHSRVLGVPG